MTIDNDFLRSQGVVVHGDGNIFFANVAQLNAVIAVSAPAQQAAQTCATCSQFTRHRGGSVCKFHGRGTELASYCNDWSPCTRSQPSATKDYDLSKALVDAAKSLETIGRLAGRDKYMEAMYQVRGYAIDRAQVARDALSGTSSAESRGDAS